VTAPDRPGASLRPSYLLTSGQGPQRLTNGEVVAAGSRQVKAGGHELTGGLALHPPAVSAPAGTSIWVEGRLCARSRNAAVGCLLQTALSFCLARALRFIYHYMSLPPKNTMFEGGF